MDSECSSFPTADRRRGVRPRRLKQSKSKWKDVHRSVTGNLCTSLATFPVPITRIQACRYHFCVWPCRVAVLQRCLINGFMGNPSSSPFRLPQFIPQWMGCNFFLKLSPSVIWSNSRFVLGRLGKDQKARVILRSSLYVPLLISALKHWSAPACAKAPGMLWFYAVANDCSLFSPTVTSVLQFLSSLVHSQSPLNRYIHFKSFLKTYSYCNHNMVLIWHWGPGCSAVIAEQWCLFNLNLGPLCYRLVNFVFEVLYFPDLCSSPFLLSFWIILCLFQAVCPLMYCLMCPRSEQSSRAPAVEGVPKDKSQLAGTHR